ncbi:MAG: mechanosensitive ion channel family protein [Bryobacteraceae bacterium]
MLNYFPEPWRGLIVPLVAFFAMLAAGLVLRRLLFARLRKWAQATTTHVDETLLDALHSPFLLWITILAIDVATDISQLPRNVTFWSQRALLVLWILSLTLVATRLASRLVRIYLPIGTLAEFLASLLAGSLGALMLLRTFGIDITPILTALGVGGLAVALALQDTLSNLFAGFYVSVAGHIRVGDFIQLETGQRGYVTDIGWRSTTLRERANNLIIIPNNKLAQSTVSNFHLPQRTIALSIAVGVSFDADLAKVERVLLEIAQAEIPGLLKEPAPTVLLLGFGERALDFQLTCQIEEFEAQFPVQHELRKRIVERFRAEGIVIPRAPSA